jgi:hypothetical protein
VAFHDKRGRRCRSGVPPWSTTADRGQPLPQWQIEVISGGRIWYLIDAERRRVVVLYASPRHPKATD